MRNIIGIRLKEIRNKRRWSQVDLATKSGGRLKKSTISVAELDPNYNPSLEIFIEMYRYVDIPFDELLLHMGYGEEYLSSKYKQLTQNERG